MVDGLATEPVPDGVDGRGLLKRLLVRSGRRVVVIPVDGIEYLEARGDYVAVHGTRGRHLVHMTLERLVAQLPSELFLRVHRSYAVNLQAVVELVSNASRFEVVLGSGARVMASRSRSRLLRGLVMK